MKNILLHSKHYLYADDTVIFISGNNAEDVVNKLQIDLTIYGTWCKGNKLTVNTKKSNLLPMVQNPKHQNLIMLTLC